MDYLKTIDDKAKQAVQSNRPEEHKKFIQWLLRFIDRENKNYDLRMNYYEEIERNQK